jgi:aspartate aminotransferase-like enzyme
MAAGVITGGEVCIRNCPVQSMGSTIEKLKEVKELMRGHGYLFDPGYGKINKELAEQGESPIFRVGHMADIMPDMLRKYLEVLGGVLNDFK